MSDDAEETYIPIGYTALHSAVYYNNIRMLENLLKEKDVDVNLQNRLGETPLMISILRRCPSTTIISLINTGCDVNIADQLNRTPLHIAVMHNDLTIAHELIKRGADVDMQDCSKSNPLFHAINANNVEALCMLLYYGADVTIRNAENHTPFRYAINNFNKKMIHILLNYYDDFNDTDKKGYTLLHSIIKYGSGLAMQLVDEGADVNTITNDGHCALECSLTLAGLDLYKKIWSKMDLYSLLKIKVPLLITYFKLAWCHSTVEWVECLRLMLESPIAADLMQHYSKYIFTRRRKKSFLAELLHALFKRVVSPDDRLHIIGICVSLGAEVTPLDMDTAIHLYGFNEELEALIYAAGEQWGTYNISHPLLPYILGLEYFQLENVIKLCKRQINGDNIVLSRCLQPVQVVIANSLEFFSLPCYMKLELLRVCSVHSYRQSNHHRIAEKVKTAHEFPSLLELSRNQAHRFIRQISGSKQPYHFQDAVKKLQLPPSIVDVLRFKKPLYR